MLNNGRQANPADMDRGEITSVSGGWGLLLVGVRLYMELEVCCRLSSQTICHVAVQSVQEHSHWPAYTLLLLHVLLVWLIRVKLPSCGRFSEH